MDEDFKKVISKLKSARLVCDKCDKDFPSNTKKLNFVMLNGIIMTWCHKCIKKNNKLFNS